MFFHSSRIRTLVAIVTYSFHRLIMGKVELGNFYCLIGDDRILICFSRTISRLKVTSMFMALTNSYVVLFYCCTTADILTKLLQQCFLCFIVVVIPGQ